MKGHGYGSVLGSMNVDYTEDFDTWEQCSFRKLPNKLRNFLNTAHGQWDHHWRNTLALSEPNDADEIVPGLWLGDIDSARKMPMFHKYGEMAVLNMAKEINDEQICHPTVLIKIGIYDGTVANVGVFDKAADVLHSAMEHRVAILVHCAAGISRSATAVIAYLMKHGKLPFNQALSLVRSKRPVANPHPHLIRSLIRDLGQNFNP